MSDSTLPDSREIAITYGELREGVYLSGFTRERAQRNLLRSLTGFAALDHEPAVRREIAAAAKREGASQRATAQALGVGPMTVNRDLKAVSNDTPGPGNPNEIKDRNPKAVSNDTPAPVRDPGEDAKRLEKTEKRPRSGNASHDNDDEWYTPPVVVEACRAALGSIDLDPASNPVANEVVQAARYFTLEDDGLAQVWTGRMFMNPPYSRDAGKREFVAKLAAHYQDGDVTAACVVLSYDFSASWFEPLRPLYSAIALMRGRVQFYKQTPGDGHDPALGTSVVYLGHDVTSFAEAFLPLADVVLPYGR